MTGQGWNGPQRLAGGGYILVLRTERSSCVGGWGLRRGTDRAHFVFSDCFLSLWPLLGENFALCQDRSGSLEIPALITVVIM